MATKADGSRSERIVATIIDAASSLLKMSGAAYCHESDIFTTHLFISLLSSEMMFSAWRG